MPDTAAVLEHIPYPQTQGNSMKLLQKTLFGMVIGLAATAAMAGTYKTDKGPGTIVAVAAANPDCAAEPICNAPAS